MSKIDARILTEGEHDQWDNFVERSEQGTIFHSSKWIKITAKFLQSEYIIIGVFKDTELIGGCSFYIKSLFSVFKIGYSNGPLIPWGGFVIPVSKRNKVRESETREREIISLILEKIRTLNLIHMKIVNSPGFNDIRHFQWQGWTECLYYTYINSLDNDILLNFSSKARTNIRKAQKFGITVKKEYNPDVLWELTEFTYSKQNMKIPYQKEYLFTLMEMLYQNNLGELWIAEMPTGEPASAVFMIYDTHLAHTWVGANNPQFKHTGVTSLLEFEIYKDLQSRGFHQVNMMGANYLHLAKFYSEFNPQLVPYYGIKRTKWIQSLFNVFGYLKVLIPISFSITLLEEQILSCTLSSLSGAYIIICGI